MSETRTFAIRTMGCRINQYESQALREAWLARGWRETDAKRAGLVLFNTCAVTARAVQELRGQVRQAHRDNPDAEIVLTGCAAQLLAQGQAQELAQELDGLPGVAVVVDQARKAGLGGYPELGAPLDVRAFPPMSITDFKRARPILKIQDGCSHGCAYCIVPHSRGPSRSRPVADILAEAHRLLKAGFRELVLGGINLRHFGRDLEGKPDLWDLLTHLHTDLAPKWTGSMERARLRLSSLDPAQLGNKALDTLAALSESGFLCPHLHLSVQSLSPQVLRAMGRAHYDPEGIAEFLDRLGRLWPIFGLGADLLTGFPGEEERHFEQTLVALESLPLTYAHVFPYSRRPGTRAAAMPGQSPQVVKRERARLLRELASRKQEAFAQRLASLDRVAVVMEASGRRKAACGVCEYFVECRFDTPPAGAEFKSLVAGRPLAAQAGALRLAPA